MYSYRVLSMSSPFGYSNLYSSQNRTAGFITEFRGFYSKTVLGNMHQYAPKGEVMYVGSLSVVLSRISGFLVFLFVPSW